MGWVPYFFCMKTFKIVLAIYLIYILLKSCFHLMAEEPASGMMYPIITLVFMLIPGLLLRSALKK